MYEISSRRYNNEDLAKIKFMHDLNTIRSYSLLYPWSSHCQPNHNEPVEHTEISAPGANEGVLVGTLIAPSSSLNPGQPYADIRIYLGTLLIADDGKTTLARVNHLTAPQTFTDASGHFVFTGLEPGEYIITVQVPPNGLVKLNEPGTGRDQVIKVEGGKITDIGTQEHDLPWFITPVP